MASVTRGLRRKKNNSGACGARYIRCIAASAAALLGCWASAKAETAPRSEQQGAESSAGLTEVVVTARYKSENVQEIPIAVTAVSAREIEERGYENIVDVAAAAPNVQMQTNIAAFGRTVTSFIRGVGQNDFNYALEPGVGMYIDDVYFGTVYGDILGLSDVDRVEVLRGPQGTLFGKNSEGGAIRIFTARPKGNDAGYLQIGFGQFQRKQYKGAFDTALIPDVLFLRVSGGAESYDGFVRLYDFACLNPGLAGNLKPTTTNPGCQTGTLGGDDTRTARAALRWKPSDSLEVNVSADISDEHGESPPQKTVLLNPDFPLLGAFNANVAIPRFGIPYDARFQTSSPYTTYASFTNPLTGSRFPPVSLMNQWGTTGTVDWDAGSVHVTSISGYRIYTAQFSQEQGGAPILLGGITNLLEHSQSSEELRVSGHLFDQKLEWTAGGYYYHGDSFNGGPVEIPLFLGVVTPVGPISLNFQQFNSAITEDKSAFVHLNYHFTDALSLEAGVRYTDETKRWTVDEPNIASGLSGPVLSLVLVPTTTQTTKTNRADPKVGIQYQFTHDLMGYVQFSTGFKSGGINPRPLTAAQLTSFGPETLDAYEIGLKSEWLEHRLRVNAAVFDSEYRGLQIAASGLDKSGTLQILTESVGHARITGAEEEIVFEPIKGLSINQDVGYLHYKTLDLGSAAGVAGGPTLDTKPAGIPTITANAGIQYAISLGAWDVTPRVDYSYKSKIYNDAPNSVVAATPAIGLWNARLTLAPSAGKWALIGSMTNLTNKAYYANSLPLNANFAIEEVPAPPREWMISLRYAF